MRRWKDEAELAAMLMERGNAGKRVTLEPQTAWFVGSKMLTASMKPTVHEVALLLCTGRNPCAQACLGCIGRANKVVNVYGLRVG